VTVTAGGARSAGGWVAGKYKGVTIMQTTKEKKYLENVSILQEKLEQMERRARNAEEKASRNQYLADSTKELEIEVIWLRGLVEKLTNGLGA